MKQKLKYISLFSGSGIGCYGYKMADFECVATCELLAERINIQKLNKKCKLESGYILGNIIEQETKTKMYNELKKWNIKSHDLDIIVATPPCQGMSTANYKKNNEINRNSLVLEAINIVNELKPKVFVFENVKSFLKTECIDKSKNINKIECVINSELSNDYNILFKIINFKDYGVPSSRPRTIVIGTRKDIVNISPLNIFPNKETEIPLKDCISDFKCLDQMGEIDSNDFLHSFRDYPKYVREWINCLKENQSAFELENKPYRIIAGEKHELKSGHMGNKFKRLSWNKVAPCVTTRNDQLGSQNTIHPRDDRVLSIRELMKIMTIPDEFKWFHEELEYINNLNFNEKKYF